VLSADGAALAYALVITALCFRAVYKHGRVWERSLWMTLCALTVTSRKGGLGAGGMIENEQ
jgi:hypothetical protein